MLESVVCIIVMIIPGIIVMIIPSLKLGARDDSLRLPGRLVLSVSMIISNVRLMSVRQQKHHSAFCGAANNTFAIAFDLTMQHLLWVSEFQASGIHYHTT